MSTTRVRKSAKRLALAATAAGAVTIMAANAAMAAPFATQATATAVHLSVIDPVLVVDTGVESAQNDGSTPTVTDSEQPLISVLVPARNEAERIGPALDALFGLGDGETAAALNARVKPSRVTKKEGWSMMQMMRIG